VDYLHIPWFEFNEFVQGACLGPFYDSDRSLLIFSSYFSQRQVHQQYPAFVPCDDWNLPWLPEINNIDSSIPQLPLPEHQWSFHDIEATSQTGFVPDLCGDDYTRYLSPFVQAADEIQNPLNSHTSNEEARSIFADIIGNPYLSCAEDVESAIASRLGGFLPERQDGELVRNVKKIFDLSSIVDASLQLLRYAVSSRLTIFCSIHKLTSCSSG